MARLEDIVSTARVFAGTLEPEQERVLGILCAAAEQQLASRLLPDIPEERYQESFVCAAAWLALAALGEGRQADGVTGFTAGDLSIQRGGASGAGYCLRLQAQLLMAPYLRDNGFCFLEV